jgi:hypothetical protein
MSRSLRHLVLYEVDSYLEVLGTVIKNNTSLASIVAVIWDIPSPAFFSLVSEGLACNNTLKRLALVQPTRRRLTVGTPWCLLEALEERNLTVESLELPPWWEKQADRDGDHMVFATMLGFYLRLNQAGRYRLVCDAGHSTATRKEWAEIVISYKEDTPVVFYFLRCNPALLA